MRLSNSSERNRGPFWFLERCLDAIEKEAPVAYGRVVRGLGSRAVRVAIGDDVATLSMASGGHEIARDAEVVRGSRAQATGCAVELIMTEAIIGCLLEGRRTILDAALDGDLVLRGSVDDLAALHDALVAFIHGAVRSPSTPRLLESYLDRDRPPSGRTRSPGATHLRARPTDRDGERHGPPQR